MANVATNDDITTEEAFVSKPIPEGATFEETLAILMENVENHRKKMDADLARETAKSERLRREFEQRMTLYAESTRQQVTRTKGALKAQAITIAAEQDERHKTILNAIASQNKHTSSEFATLRKEGPSLTTQVGSQQGELESQKSSREEVVSEVELPTDGNKRKCLIDESRPYIEALHGEDGQQDCFSDNIIVSEQIYDFSTDQAKYVATDQMPGGQDVAHVQQFKSLEQVVKYNSQSVAYYEDTMFYDMVVGDKADLGTTSSPKFQLKISPRQPTKILGGQYSFYEPNFFQVFDTKYFCYFLTSSRKRDFHAINFDTSELGVRHRWPPPWPSRDPSDLTDFVINKGNGVKGLSQMGLKSLPKQYIQPLEERMSMNMTKMPEESIPIIHVSNWEDPKVAESICNAAEKWGFFQLLNHGVPTEVLEHVKEATHRFFEMPAEEKCKFSKEHSPSTNVRFGTSFSPEAETALEWKDWLSLFYVSEDEASAHWPPVCKAEVLEYMKRTDILIKRLLDILMKRLNVTEINTTKEPLLMGSRRINLNYFPVCPNPELTVGVGRHSDVSTLTILLQEYYIGGLYVRPEFTDEDTWVHVPPLEGSLVINVGDALQIMSNGKYKSVEHRVAANGSKTRISVPIFVNPRPSDVIGPLHEVLESSGEKPLYKQVLYSDYVKHFFRKAHDGKSTVDFAKI
ncbi:feruloyl CoA ortho-hydroxylase F6H1-3 [Rosa chinensis]|nr:feruloyl CoA ortho-hydroxylase F6H1-3 [Rosa chinensis]